MTRDKMENEARALRATPVGSVSKNTSLVVFGEKIGGSQAKAAEKHQVEMLSEEQYRARLTTNA